MQNILLTIKGWWIEIANFVALSSLEQVERRLIFYSEDTATYRYFEEIINRLKQYGLSNIVYITSDFNDPLITNSPDDVKVFYLYKLFPKFISNIAGTVLVTTMPDLGNLTIKRPPKSTTLVYCFHSLNSIHAAYRNGAFDHYDHFLLTGKHQLTELTRHFNNLGKIVGGLHRVGYGRLDRIARDHKAYKNQWVDETILIAPSWGKDNLLELVGHQIIESILKPGRRIIVRPHPCFFLPIYPIGKSIIAEIEMRFANDSNVVIETSTMNEDSFHEADVMISDWSGAAFEYSLGTERPVIFIDVPRKILNPFWEKLDIIPFEQRLRHQIGQVVSVSEISELNAVIAELRSSREQYREIIHQIRLEQIYNFGQSNDKAASVLIKLLGSEGRPRLEDHSV